MAPEIGTVRKEPPLTWPFKILFGAVFAFAGFAILYGLFVIVAILTR